MVVEMSHGEPRRVKRTVRRVAGGLLALAAWFPVDDAAAITGVTCESVNDYSYTCSQGYCCTPSTTHCLDTICNTESNSFWNAMTASGTIWTAKYHYTDSSVYDTDFYDPQRTGLSYDNDTNNFDASGNAISYTCLHGFGLDFVFGSTPCNSSSDCSFGECMNEPPSAAGYKSLCTTSASLNAVTSSSSSKHNNFVNYSTNGVAWGEDASSGTWGGAGTNGSTNVVFLINSLSVRPYYWGEISPIFAGLHLLANIMVVNVNNSTQGSADARNDTSRGSNLASYALANPGHAVSEAWFATMDSASSTNGPSCPDFNSDYTYGGGHGITGCGAYMVSSWDHSLAAVQWHDWNESWYGAQFESNDATGNNYAWLYWHCNYDCNTYPFTK